MNKSVLRNIIVVVLLLGLLFAAMPTQQAQAATLQVCQDATCTYQTIQSAIVAAADGDIIEVAAGTYAERLTIDKGITLRGPNFEKTGYANDRVAEAIITYPSGITETNPALVDVQADNVTIEGFKFEAVDDYLGQFTNHIHTFSSNNFVVRNNVINGTEIGIYRDPYNPNFTYADNTGWLVEGNLIDGGRYVNSRGGRGMYIYRAAAIVRNNHIFNHNSGIQILPAMATEGGVVENNTISAGAIGLYHNGAEKGSGAWTYSGNTISIAPNDRSAQDVWVPYPLNMDVDFRAIHIINQGLGTTGELPTVTFTNNSADMTEPAGSLLRDTIAVRINESNPLNVENPIVINENNFINFSIAVDNSTANVPDATLNYWGSAAGPEQQDLIGEVDFVPYYLDPERNQLVHVTTLTMDPVELDACNVGSEYLISVNIGPVYEFSGYQIRIQYDINKLQVLELINGDVLIGSALELKDLGADDGILDYSRALTGQGGQWNLIDDPDGGILMQVKVKTKGTGPTVMTLLESSTLSRTDDAWSYPYNILNETTTIDTSEYAVTNGTTNFCDLQTAVNQTAAGGTLTALRDFNVKAAVAVEKAITFDTAGFTVTRTGATGAYSGVFQVMTGGNLSIEGTGTVNSTNDAGTLGTAVVIYGGTLNLEEATLSGSYASVAVFADYGTPPTPGTFNMSSGTTTDGVFIFENGSTFNLTGGTVKTTKNQFAIAGNGDSWAAGTIINISGDAKVISEQAVAIYHPQDGTLTISGDAEISGPSAIQMKSGDLTVTGGTITATGSFIATPDPTDDGAQNTGDAIFAFSKEGYADFLNVEISGGTITSANGYAVREYVVPGETSRTQNVTISGGQLSGGPDAVFFSSDTDEVLDLTGGAYNTNPAAFVFYPLETYSYVDGAKTWYGIRYMWPVINTDTGIIYASLAQAVGEAQAGETLQARVEFETTGAVGVSKEITFDANGKTITRTNPASAYSGVFQVMKNGNLTITDTSTTGPKGIIKTTNTAGTLGSAVVIYGGTLNLEEATLSGGYVSVAVYEEYNVPNPTPGIFNMSSGTTTDGIVIEDEESQLNISGGTVKTTKNQFAIAGNGTEGCGGTIINISGDAKVISEQTLAIFHPQDGALTISDNAEISGPSGIQMKAGDLTISGTPTITATGTFVANPVPPTNGAQPTGDAIFIVSQTNYTGDLNLNISGGTITSANGYAVREFVGSGTTKLVNATISDGQLSGGAGAVDFASNTDALLDLVGGAYSTDPSAFVYIPKYVYFDAPWYRLGDMVGAVTGTVSMQGRLERSGVPVTMTGGSVVIPTVFSTNDSSGNVSFAYLVPNTTYTITTNQPRYLNITSDMLKNKLIVNGTETLAILRLIGGNALWENDNVIDLDDFSFVGGKYGFAGETDADVNFDGVVNIRDLALVAGNMDLTGAVAYGNWIP